MLNGATMNKQTMDPEVLQHMQEQIEDLKKQLARARGTEEIQPVEPEVKLDLAAKIEQALRANVYTTEELARVVGAPIDRVQEKIKAMRKFLADVGTPAQARWVWRIGDQTSAKELRDVVARLIEGHKMTTAELTKITGARMSRVNGVLVELQRDPAVSDRIYNLGSKFRHLWLIMPKDAKPVPLPKKAPKNGKS